MTANELLTKVIEDAQKEVLSELNVDKGLVRWAGAQMWLRDNPGEPIPDSRVLEGMAQHLLVIMADRFISMKLTSAIIDESTVGWKTRYAEDIAKFKETFEWQWKSEQQ